MRHSDQDPEERVERMLADHPDGDHRYLLWGSHLRATPARVGVLKALSDEGEPLSVDVIHGKMDHAIDRVTTYRTLESLTEAGLVGKTRLSVKDDSDPPLYELVFGRKHHHHAICTSCGYIEDIFGCKAGDLQGEINKSLKKFSRIDNHSAEYFGICKKCATALPTNK